ncbi:MAG: class I SAM-dependent methyltransferase [Leptolyngbya sp. BL-A-14]
MEELTYSGKELNLFAEAKNWKSYVRNHLKNYIKGDVLEVGAGIGSNTCSLSSCSYRKWLCLEPDPNLFQSLETEISSCSIVNCYAQKGTIDTLTNEQIFDSILYLDVLEHIYEDREEVAKVIKHLKANGNLIILAPAHQWLFTPFDSAIGHYRRYSKLTLEAVLPDSVEVTRLIYIDSVGLLASLANKLLLRQSQPTLRQIKVWDKVMVPVSSKTDAILGYQLGKTVLLVGKKKVSK